MNEGQLRAAVEAALAEVSFTPPLTVTYCVAVRDALRARVPGAVLEVYHRLVELVVDARDGTSSYKLRLRVS